MMTMTKQRITTIFVLLTSAATALVIALGTAIAHAQGSDQETAAQATSDLVDILLKHKLLGVLMIGYTVIAKLLEVNKTQGWITSGRWLAIISGVVATAAAFVDLQLGSGTLEALVLAAFGAVLLVIRSTVGPPAAAPAPAPNPEAA